MIHGGNTCAASTVLAMLASWIHADTQFPLTVFTRSTAVDAVRHHARRFRIKKEQATVMLQLADDYEEAVALAREATLIAAALLRCWAKEIGLPPDDLLQTIALGQAMDREEATTTTE